MRITKTNIKRIDIYEDEIHIGRMTDNGDYSYWTNGLEIKRYRFTNFLIKLLTKYVEYKLAKNKKEQEKIKEIQKVWFKQFKSVSNKGKSIVQCLDSEGFPKYETYIEITDH